MITLYQIRDLYLFGDNLFQIKLRINIDLERLEEIKQEIEEEGRKSRLLDKKCLGTIIKAEIRLKKAYTLAQELSK